MNTPKIWYKSWTLWFNILTIAAGALTAAVGIYPNVGWIATGLAIVNFVLRLKTDQPVSFSSQA